MDIASPFGTSEPLDWQILGRKVVVGVGTSQTHVIGPLVLKLFFVKFADFWWDDDIFLRVNNFSKFSKSCDAAHHNIWPVDWLILGGMVMEVDKCQVKVAKLRFTKSDRWMAGARWDGCVGVQGLDSSDLDIADS